MTDYDLDAIERAARERVAELERRYAIQEAMLATHLKIAAAAQEGQTR